MNQFKIMFTVWFSPKFYTNFKKFAITVLNVRFLKFSPMLFLQGTEMDWFHTLWLPIAWSALSGLSLAFLDMTTTIIHHNRQGLECLIHLSEVDLDQDLGVDLILDSVLDLVGDSEGHMDYHLPLLHLWASVSQWVIKSSWLKFCTN